MAQKSEVGSVLKRKPGSPMGYPQHPAGDPGDIPSLLESGGRPGAELWRWIVWRTHTPSKPTPYERGCIMPADIPQKIAY
jgi:hypothetical protein